MLLLVTDLEEKRAAQTALERTVRAGLADQGLRNIGFPSGNADEVIYANGDGDLWAAFAAVDGAAVPRRWNAFGVFDPKRHAQMITVEINIPTTSNSARVAGFFARDAASGQVFLMHDGSVGGGKPGVGRNAFLAWSKTELVEAYGDGGEVRSGVIIGSVDSDALTGRLWRFVQLVKGFKDAVKRGDLDDPEVRKAIAEWDTFNSESAGRRQGRRRADIDYISYHGEVVERLYEERSSRIRDGERVLNSRLIDLYVRNGTAMTEIYEVKTSTDRQSIYTAIGQLVSHSVGAAADVKRTLVIPEGALPPDLDRCLDSLSVRVRRFTLSSGKAPKVVLS
jgi:hypothetical protein